MIDFSEIHHSRVASYIEEYLIEQGVNQLDITGLEFDSVEKIREDMYKVYVSWENYENKLRQSVFVINGRFYEDGVVNDVKILEF